MQKAQRIRAAGTGDANALSREFFHIRTALQIHIKKYTTFSGYLQTFRRRLRDFRTEKICAQV